MRLRQHSKIILFNFKYLPFQNLISALETQFLGLKLLEGIKKESHYLINLELICYSHKHPGSH